MVTPGWVTPAYMNVLRSSVLVSFNLSLIPSTHSLHFGIMPSMHTCVLTGLSKGVMCQDRTQGKGEMAQPKVTFLTLFPILAMALLDSGEGGPHQGCGDIM